MKSPLTTSLRMQTPINKSDTIYDQKQITFTYMKLQKLFYFTFLLFIISNSFSQKGKVVAADKKYDKYSYVDAIKTYERIVAKGYKSIDLFEKLGNSYYFNSEFEKAEKNYTELFALKKEVDPEYYFRYAQCLKAVGNYKKADEMLTKFNQKSGNDERAKLFEKNKDYLKTIKTNSGKYVIKNLDINSEYSDYGSFVSENKLIFASSRETGEFGVRNNSWNKQSYVNMFESEIKTDSIFLKPQKLIRKLNTRFHECSAIFTRDGNTMYFTRNNFIDGKKGRNENRTILLKLYKATKIENQWNNITELPFNSNQYSTAHAALSNDEKVLYFASDMPGTLGQSDIFKVAINSDGSYGNPENLGKNINTEGRETFPFISSENELFFATDGQQGLGGLDVFVSNIKSDNNFSDPKNIGEPINSPSDDFGFFQNSDSKSGYFSSNRIGGKGSDDVYRFSKNVVIKCEQELTGILTDKDTGEILDNTEVIVLDNSFQEIAKGLTNETGFYSFKVDCGSIVYVRSKKPDYQTSEQKVEIPIESGKVDWPVKLEKVQKPVTVGDDLSKIFGIKIIYFDLDKSNVRKDAEIDLEKILDVMKQYQTMTVDIRSHTDSRSSTKYNEGLSERRAKSTLQWLIANGINPERLTSKGYGESLLVNKCSDGVNCSEEEHQLNRRSEFIITSK